MIHPYSLHHWVYGSLYALLGSDFQGILGSLDPNIPFPCQLLRGDFQVLVIGDDTASLLFLFTLVNVIVVCQLQNSRSLYAPDICPSCFSISPCSSISAFWSVPITELICHADNDLRFLISMSSQLDTLGLRTSSIGFQSSPVINIVGKWVFSHSVGTRVLKCTTVPMVSKGIKACSMLIPKCHE